MKISEIKSNIAFRSGYPTFGVNGHLSYKPDSIHDNIYLPFKPTGVLIKEEPNKLDYYA